MFNSPNLCTNLSLFKVLIVAGGWSDDTTEKHLGDVTTEKHVIGEDSWKTISPLPKKFWTHSLGDAIVSMNNKIYIFGKQAIENYVLTMQYLRCRWYR